MPNTCRRFLVLTFAAIVVGLGVGVWVLWPRTAITANNATKIEQGMTLEQVEVILGGPTRDDSTGPLVAEQWEDDPTQRDVHRFVGYVPVRVVAGRGTGTADAMPICWASDSLVLWVVFDSDGRVLYHYSQVVFRDAKNPLDMLRRWLGL